MKVEKHSSYEDLDDTNDEIETDNQSKTLIVKLDDEILKGIETGPVSR